MTASRKVRMFRRFKPANPWAANRWLQYRQGGALRFGPLDLPQVWGKAGGQEHVALVRQVHARGTLLRLRTHRLGNIQGSGVDGLGGGAVPCRSPENAGVLPTTDAMRRGLADQERVPIHVPLPQSARTPANRQGREFRDRSACPPCQAHMPG